MQNQILAADFKLRSDLDEYIRNEYGDDINANRVAGYTIAGTAEDLQKLNLSTSTRVYGIKVVLLQS